MPKHLRCLAQLDTELSRYNARFALKLRMLELNPLYNHIKDLRSREASLRGYL